MTERSFHVVPHAKGWAIRRTAAKRATSVFISQSSAWRNARRLARASECSAFLHDKGGRIVAVSRYATRDLDVA